MGSKHHFIHALRRKTFQLFRRNAFVGGPVVDTGQYMSMQINHFLYPAVFRFASILPSDDTENAFPFSFLYSLDPLIVCRFLPLRSLRSGKPAQVFGSYFYNF